MRDHIYTALIVVVAIYLSVIEADYLSGLLMGAVIFLLISRVFNLLAGTERLYRRWYLICREALEKIAYEDGSFLEAEIAKGALNQIDGPTDA